MSQYNRFARFYDFGMGERSQEYRLIANLISSNAPHAKSILELGCGTGSVLSSLPKRYELSGIDKSRKMLEIARTKLPNANLKLGSMTTFKTTKRFDVVLCVYDSI